MDVICGWQRLTCRMLTNLYTCNKAISGLIDFWIDCNRFCQLHHKPDKDVDHLTFRRYGLFYKVETARLRNCCFYWLRCMWCHQQSFIKWSMPLIDLCNVLLTCVHMVEISDSGALYFWRWLHYATANNQLAFVYYAHIQCNSVIKDTYAWRIVWLIVLIPYWEFLQHLIWVVSGYKRI